MYYVRGMRGEQNSQSKGGLLQFIEAKMEGKIRVT